MGFLGQSSLVGQSSKTMNFDARTMTNRNFDKITMTEMNYDKEEL
jgi:hypothetical protein